MQLDKKVMLEICSNGGYVISKRNKYYSYIIDPETKNDIELPDSFDSYYDAKQYLNSYRIDRFIINVSNAKENSKEGRQLLSDMVIFPDGRVFDFKGNEITGDILSGKYCIKFKDIDQLKDLYYEKTL